MSPSGTREARVQRVLVWAGPAMICLWVFAFVLIAKFIPPHDPAAPARAIADIYREDGDRIRAGLVLTMAAAALLVPWSVAIAGQVMRIEGARALAVVQLLCCALLSLEFIFPVGIWMTASFRPDTTAVAITQALDDLGWILFVGVVWSVEVQMICLGWAILMDRTPRPVYPRWTGYLNLWVAVTVSPGALVSFFKDGPLAWNGILPFYIPLVVFALWIGSMTWATHRALTLQIADAAPRPGPSVVLRATS
jgi:hypothetical protein